MSKMFEQLPNELILEIFEYLSCNDILYTFFYLNQRFQSILLQHHRFLNNFTTPTNHASFWQTILPVINSQIKSFTITTTFNLPSSLDSFLNLKSLVISAPFSIWHDELSSIFQSEQFKKLHSFQIQSDIIADKCIQQKFFCTQIINDNNSLLSFEYAVKQPYYFTYHSPSRIDMHLQSLSLKLGEIHSLFGLFSAIRIPNLKDLNVILQSSIVYKNQPYSNIDMSYMKLKTLCLELEQGANYRIIFLLLMKFIKHFSSSLISLSLDLNYIDTNSFTFDGFTLQEELLESMITLKLFHFHVQLTNQHLDTERFWSTLRTQFLIDHQWLFGLHGSHLYTLPYHLEKYKDFIDFDHIKPSDPLDMKCLKPWPHVRTIHLSPSFKYTSNVLEQIKYRMPNLTSIFIQRELMNDLYESILQNSQANVMLDNILTVNCPYGNPQIIKHCLINMFPNTKHLILAYCDHLPISSLTETDRIHNCKIQHINMEVFLRTGSINDQEQQVLYFLKELFELFEDIQSITIYFMRAFEGLSPRPFTDKNKMCQLLNIPNVFEIYQFTYINDYLRVIKKNVQ